MFDLKEINENACTRTALDFLKLKGDSLLEKYTSIFKKIREFTKSLSAKGGSEPFWIITSPEIAVALECSYKNFIPSSISTAEIRRRGTLGKNYELWSSALVKDNCILVGCKYDDIDFKHCGVIFMLNFL
jgi:hypothetical protein